MIKKVIKEERGLDLTVSNDDYRKHGDKVDNAVGSDGTITIEPEDDKYDLNETDVTESVKLHLNDVLGTLGVNLSNKTPEARAKLLQITQEFLNNISEYGVSIQLSEDDDKENADLDDGEFERESNRVEYGVGMNENFDVLMEKLDEKKVKTININENVNPRIKKNDLIKHINKKK